MSLFWQRVGEVGVARAYVEAQQLQLRDLVAPQYATQEDAEVRRLPYVVLDARRRLVRLVDPDERRSAQLLGLDPDCVKLADALDLVNVDGVWRRP